MSQENTVIKRCITKIGCTIVVLFVTFNFGINSFGENSEYATPSNAEYNVATSSSLKYTKTDEEIELENDLVESENKATDSNADINIASPSNVLKYCEECGGTGEHEPWCSMYASLFSLRKSIDVKEVDTIENDFINIHLFNYGTAINDPNIATNGMGFLPFFHNHSYTETHDNVMDGSNTYSGKTKLPILSRTLVDGYPYLAEDGLPSDYEIRLREGSLKYLFDTSKDFVKGSGNLSSYNLPDGVPYGTPASYQSKHFECLEGDSGLFQYHGSNYWYDSYYNAAYYDTDAEQFIVYDSTIGPIYLPEKTSTTTAYGNFFPFNEMTDDTVTLWEEFDNHPIVDGEEVDLYLLDGDDIDSRTDLWFGMSVDFEFNQPEDGITNAGEEMEFNFSGDDDVWVFVDDVLILDIGGAHGAKPGYINFVTGDVTYENSIETVETTLYEQFNKAYTELKDKNTSQAKRIKGIIDNFEEIIINGETCYRFKDWSEHTFKMFYLERGGHTSNCKLEFNIEPLPSGQLTIEKTEENVSDTYKGENEYKFQLLKDIDGTLEPINYAEFTIDDPENNGISTNNIKSSIDGTYKVTENAEFWLKDGQIANFTSGITTNDSIIVKELNNKPEESLYDTKYELKVNGDIEDAHLSNVTNEFQIEDPDYNYSLEFVNTYNKKDLIIEKVISGNLVPTQGFKFNIFDSDSTKIMEVWIDPDDFVYSTDKEQMIGQITIKDFLIGDYYVEEDTNWSWRYEIASNTNITQNIRAKEDWVVSYINIRKTEKDDQKWFSAETYKINRFN